MPKSGYKTEQKNRIGQKEQQKERKDGEDAMGKRGKRRKKESLRIKKRVK